MNSKVKAAALDLTYEMLNFHRESLISDIVLANEIETRRYIQAKSFLQGNYTDITLLEIYAESLDASLDCVLQFWFCLLALPASVIICVFRFAMCVFLFLWKSSLACRTLQWSRGLCFLSGLHES